MAGDSARQATVLVIDDEESICQGCCQALEEQGYPAQAARDAGQGLRLAEQTRPDVVLLDLKLPDMGGLEVLQKMRQTVPGAVPIVITGHGTIESAVEAMRMGAYEYLCKPFDDQVLVAAVGRGLALRNKDSKSTSLKRDRRIMPENPAAAKGRNSLRPDRIASQRMQTAKNRLIDPLTHEEKRPLERPPQCTGEICGSIRDWQKLEQMEEMLSQLRPEAVELGAVFKESWAAIPAGNGRNRVDLRVNIPEGTMPVLGDADLLREVFVRLLSNAVGFIPGTGRIIVNAVTDGGCIVVSVSNTGSGIPAEVWPCVFEDFYQGADPDARRADDSGLGLVTARRIVAAHGGTITVQNGPGPGATFVVRLPAVSGNSAKERAMNRETVVVIDDEESMREGCRQALEGKGYVARIASDGEEGVHLVKQLRPEVVLVDLKMPGIDGMETLRRIKQIDPYVVSIVITGYGTVESIVTAMRLGVSDCLCKPFDDDQLLTAVESGLEGHSTRRKDALALPQAGEEEANGETIIEVLERAACEQSFAAELMEKGSDALEAYELTSFEKAAIACGDIAWIENHGVKLNDKQRSWLNSRLEQERW